MFNSGPDFARVKRYARAVIALGFLASNIAPGYAQDLAGNAYPQRAFAGHTAMLGLRIPFGSEGNASSQPIVGLMVGSSWRAAPGSMTPQAHRFVPTVEAGLSLRGDPILRLRSLDVRLDQLRASAEGGGGQTFCGRNLAVCIVGGVAIAAVVVVALAGSDECNPLDYPDAPPGQNPCHCYEADGEC